jgi:hypothetical protein
MKTRMTCWVLILAIVTVAGKSYAAEDEAVVNPAKRQEILDQAKSLLASKGQEAPGKDPFHSEAYAESVAGGPRGETQTPNAESTAAKVAVPAGPRSPRDLLQAIATSPSLKPSGYFVLGGQPTLVFGQKRVKAGSFLTITFEGTEYALEIVSIERPNFTLRLNREEFTRPIK